jgi:hypothetical protein
MQYGNTAIILMVIAVVLFVLSLAFVGMYCLNKAVDEKRPT